MNGFLFSNSAFFFFFWNSWTLYSNAEQIDHRTKEHRPRREKKNSAFVVSNLRKYFCLFQFLLVTSELQSAIFCAHWSISSSFTLFRLVKVNVYIHSGSVCAEPRHSQTTIVLILYFDFSCVSFIEKEKQNTFCTYRQITIWSHARGHWVLCNM